MRKLRRAMIRHLEVGDTIDIEHMSVYPGRDKVSVVFGDGSGVIFGNCLVAEVAVDKLPDGTWKLTLTAVADNNDDVRFEQYEV